MNGEEIKLLLGVREDLTKLISKKRVHIEQLEEEIDGLNEKIGILSSMITIGSFTTAENLMDAETFLRENEDVEIKNLNYTRKIFTKANKLISSLQFQDNSIFIRILEPASVNFTYGAYVEQFVKPILVKLKQLENKLTPEVTKVPIGEEEYISTITLQNVKNIESFELVVEGIDKMFENYK